MILFLHFSLVYVLIEKTYQSRKTVFVHIIEHLKVRQKYSFTVCVIFFTLLLMFRNAVILTQSFVFDISSIKHACSTAASKFVSE